MHRQPAAVFIIVAISMLLMRGIAGSARMNMLVVIIKLTVIAAVIALACHI
ncbi:hypothetical protein [Komagataeibacter medellinensis]|uniref:hypothetical protein n=1 Tax=Komagataeibacter medellinensis TaxID=1177712 RepID=UPI001E4AFFA1|nr:hypothetical protein [Komagataeibacter medellinensis]